MFSKKFWADALERAIRTVAQSALALLVGAGPVGIHVVNWQQVGSVAAPAGVISLLMSIVASGVGDKTSASLVNLEDK
jgi:Putative lactococcus lactis phage r1t holin